MSDVSYVVFSGGSACNSLVNSFQAITPKISYILTISDNGGSTSELLRVLGGPSIGDLRSRLIHLIKTDDSTELAAIRELLNYRLSPKKDMNENMTRDEWTEIVEGRHGLWDNINIEKKETIRGFLVLFNFEILKRAHKHFNFRNGSIGNFFLTGARLFFNSLEAAIFLFSSITAIREPTFVLPAINTNQTASIAALLENGQILRGQCNISHPPANSQGTPKHINPIDAFSKLALPGSPMMSVDQIANNNLIFDKKTRDKLPAAIQRIYYMNEYGQEIYPLPNPKILNHLMTVTDMVYSIGSLYTSILPCLILRKIGYAIANSTTLVRKILILNGSNDRETPNYTAYDFIAAITNALNESQSIDARRIFYDQIEKMRYSNNNNNNNNNNNSSSSSQNSSVNNQHSQNSSSNSPNSNGSNSADLLDEVFTRPVTYPLRKWPPRPPTPPESPMKDTTTATSSSSSASAWKKNQSKLEKSKSLRIAQQEGYKHSKDLTTSNTTFPPEQVPTFSPSTYITHLVYLTNSLIPVDVPAIEALGIKCIPCPHDMNCNEPRYNEANLKEILSTLSLS